MSKTTIAVGAQNSGFINTSANILSTIYIPANMTGTTLTFLVSCSSSSDSPLFPLDDGTGSLYTVTFAAGRAVSVDPSKFGSAKGVVLVSGSVESGGVDRILNLDFISR